MSVSPDIKRKKSTTEYWAVYYIAEEPILDITFVPREDLDIDLEGDIFQQLETFFSYDEKKLCYPSDEKGYLRLDAVQDDRKVVEMFVNNSCIPVTYGST